MSTEIIITIVASVLASSGLWGLLEVFVQKRLENKDAKSEMLLGLGHDRILYLGMKYIERGWITHDEYENLVDYLYKPYKKLGGNGSADRVVNELNKLPMKPNGYNPTSTTEV